MSNINDYDRNKTQIHAMVARGTEYREDFEFDLYGTTVTAILKPLDDGTFLPLIAKLADRIDMEEHEDGEQAASKAIDKVREEEEDAAEGEPIDPAELDDEFVEVLQEAAVKGLAGAYDEDGNKVSLSDEEERRTLVENMRGGSSVELGSRVLQVTGDVRDAEKFRGQRGGVSDS